MKKIKIRHIVLAAANVAVLTAALILTLIGDSLARSQRYNYAADRWTQGRGGCTQVSCFFADDSGFIRDNVISVRLALLSSLEAAAVYPEDGKTLCPDAYSSPVGRFQVNCDRMSSAPADITAVGGEFFLFRSFDLLSGNYISDKDIMQDGAVIDRALAFRLYGSENIAGMSIYVNNVKLRVAGVVDDPRTKYERECAGDYPKMYIPYEMAEKLTDTGEQFRRVSCYEVIVPDPVENFGYNAVEKLFSSYGDNAMIVNNTDRFSSSVRVKAAKDLSRSGVRNEAVKLPFWENASRIVEHKLSVMYSVRRVILAVPALTAVWLVVKAYKWLRRKSKSAFRFASDKIYALRCRINKMIHGS
ncbi:MAG: ABC transporter permease [Ruminococcus sp.]|nr:ABC transporter permease [Ruminococcus sp.]